MHIIMPSRVATTGGEKGGGGTHSFQSNGEKERVGGSKKKTKGPV